MTRTPSLAAVAGLVALGACAVQEPPPPRALSAASWAEIETRDAALPTPRRTRRAETIAALRALLREVEPGDELVLAPGRHELDAPLELRDLAGPLLLSGQGATLAGRTGLLLRGCRDVVVRGLRLTGAPSIERGEVSAAVVLDGCARVRLTRCELALEPAGGPANWVLITGAGGDNRVDRCAFGPRSDQGTYVSILGPPGDVSKGDTIERCLFRAHGFEGKNGGEAVRVGDSRRQLAEARTRIEGNLFVDCRGDAEVISLKASRCLVRGNTLRGCDGSIVARHGSGDRIEGNVIERGRAGIRLHGPDHEVIGNMIVGTTGTDTRAALVLGGGDRAAPAAGDTGHVPAIRARVERNTVLANGPEGLRFGCSADGGELPARGATVLENRIELRQGGPLKVEPGVLTPTGRGADPPPRALELADVGPDAP